MALQERPPEPAAQEEAREIPGVERAVADALETELGADGHLAARLAAASLVAALGIAEETAAAAMGQGGRALTAAEVDDLLDAAVVFVQAGASAIRAR